MYKMILALALSIALTGCDAVNDTSSQSAHFATSLHGGVCDTVWKDTRYATIGAQVSDHERDSMYQLTDSVLQVVRSDNDSNAILNWNDWLDNDDSSYVYRYHLVTYDTTTVSIYVYLSDRDSGVSTTDNLISNNVPNTSPWKIGVRGNYAVFHMVHHTNGDTFSVKLQRLYCQ